jgi:hypothetical protein
MIIIPVHIYVENRFELKNNVYTFTIYIKPFLLCGMTCEMAQEQPMKFLEELE